MIRDFSADFLRAFFVVVMVFVHWHGTFSGFKNGWVWYQALTFIVVGLVFTSAYSLSLRNRAFCSVEDYAGFVWGRFKRLLIPYYQFVALFFVAKVLWLLYFGLSLSGLVGEVFSAFFLLGYGVELFNIGWLLLLFLFGAAFFPVVYKFKDNVFTFPLIIVLSVLVFLVLPSGERVWVAFGYLPVMWLGIRANELNVKRTTLLLVGVFLVLFGVWHLFGWGLSLPDNKFPPSPYFLVYGALACFVVLGLVKRYESFVPSAVRGCVEWVSRYSLWIFFIHFYFIQFFVR